MTILPYGGWACGICFGRQTQVSYVIHSFIAPPIQLYNASMGSSAEESGSEKAMKLQQSSPWNRKTNPGR